MKSFWRVIEKIVKVIEVHINAVIFAILFLSMVIQVFMRYVLDMPSPLLHEIMMFSFVWTVYLSAALARKHREHIRFNIIYEKLPRKAQILIDLVFDIFVSSLLVYSLWPVIDQLKMYGFIKAQITGISWTYVYMIVPIFFILVLFHNVKFIVDEVRDLVRIRRREEI